MHGLPEYAYSFDTINNQNKKRSRMSSLPSKDQLAYRESVKYEVDHGQIRKKMNTVKNLDY